MDFIKMAEEILKESNKNIILADYEGEEITRINRSPVFTLKVSCQSGSMKNTNILVDGKFLENYDSEEENSITSLQLATNAIQDTIINGILAGATYIKVPQN